MANRFAEDIRRIAKGTRFKGPLGVYSPRDPIGPHQVALITDPMALGGGYGDGGLNNETPTSEAPNSDTEQADKEGDQTRAQDPNNPNSFYKGGAGDGEDSAAGEGSFDVEDVIDGTDGPQTSIDGTSGGINEFTGMVDCDSGTPFNFHPDGFFPVPEGWDDAETPPEDPEFEVGFVWLTNEYLDNGYPREGAYTASAAQAIEAANVEAGANTNEFYTSFKEWTSGWSVSSTDGQGSPTAYSRSYLQNTILGGSDAFTAAVSRFACDSPTAIAVFGSEPSSCIESLTAEAWPEDGTFDLANKDGKFTTSQYDPDKPGDYSSSAKDFCFGDGRTGKMLVTADGGTMMYETDNGAPTGTAKVYAPDGTMRAAGDATDSFTSQYLPK